jgi:hypothetical protein
MIVVLCLDAADADILQRMLEGRLSLKEPEGRQQVEALMRVAEMLLTSRKNAARAAGQVARETE